MISHILGKAAVLLQGPPHGFSTVSCTPNVKARFTQHVSMQVDGRESPGDILHDGYEKLIKGACGLDPQLERERRRHGIEVGPGVVRTRV